MISNLTNKKKVHYYDKKIYFACENFFKKISGKIFGFSSSCIILFSILISIVLNSLSDNSYSVLTHWISQLGVGFNGSNLVFNIGLQIGSGLIIIFHIYESLELRKKGIKQIFLIPLLFSALIYSVGAYFVGLFPMNMKIHGIAAAIYFNGCLFHYLIYGYIMVCNVKGFSKFQMILTILIIQLFMVYIISQLYTTFTNAYWFGISNHILEWLACFMHFVFIFTSTFFF
jgi:hypothetical membrane protein